MIDNWDIGIEEFLAGQKRKGSIEKHFDSETSLTFNVDGVITSTPSRTNYTPLTPEFPLTPESPCNHSEQKLTLSAPLTAPTTPINKSIERTDQELKILKTRATTLSKSSHHTRKRSSVTLPITIGAPNESENIPSIYSETSKYLKRVGELQSQINYYETNLDKTQGDLIEAQNETSKYKQLLKSLQNDSSKKDIHIQEIENKLPNGLDGASRETTPETGPDTSRIKSSVQEMQIKIKKLETECERSSRSLILILNERNKLASEMAEVKLTILKLTMSKVDGKHDENKATINRQLLNLTPKQVFFIFLTIIFIITSIQLIVYWYFTANYLPTVVTQEVEIYGNWWDGTLFAPLFDKLDYWIEDVVDPWVQNQFGYIALTSIS